MNITTNYGLKKPSLTDSASITVLSDNFDIIDTTMKANGVPYAGTTTGTVNNYVISTPTITILTVGQAVSLKFNLDSTGTSTLNWCGLGAKGIKKSNGTDVTNLKATGIYTLRYDGTNFILQGEGGFGDAIASNLLLGKKASTDAGDITGSMPNNSALSSVLNCGESYQIPLGYTSGGTITTNSLSSQTVASASADQILYGITAWINGVKLTGIMPNNGAITNIIASAGGTYTIPSGYTTGGTITAPSLTTVTNGSSVTDASQIVSGYSAYSKGNLILGNATIQSLGGAKYSIATISAPYQVVTTVNIGWKPDMLILMHTSHSSSTATQHIDVITDNGMSSSLSARSDGNGWTNTVIDTRTSTGYTVTGDYYNSTSNWNCIAIKYS